MAEEKKDFVVKDRRIFAQDGDEKNEADEEKEEKIAPATFSNICRILKCISPASSWGDRGSSLRSKDKESADGETNYRYFEYVGEQDRR
jgi:hypothetical protein